MKSFNQIHESAMELNKHTMSDKQLKQYNTSMEKVMVDKCFFLDHIPDFDLLVDFGTANGALIKAVMPYENEAQYLGFDISDQMLSEAKSNVGEHKNVSFTSNWGEVERRVKELGPDKISVLTMNSLLHEVFSYSDESELKEFWHRAFNSGFTYISIRDMMMREKAFNKKISEDDLDDIKNNLIILENGEEKLESYEEIYGPIEDEGNLIHLLMKWNYWHNWEREVNEDYLGIKAEEFFRKLNTVGKGKYNIKYWQPFTLQYLKNYVKEMIDWDIKSTTHIKVILKSIK